MNEVFASIGAAFCLFLLVLIKSKQKAALGDGWLILWLALLSAYFISMGLTAVLPPTAVYAAVLVNQATFLALPPVQYFHARAATNHPVGTALWEGSFAVAIFVGLIVIPLVMPSEIVAGSLAIRNPALLALPLLIVLVSLYYPVRAFRHLRLHRRALKQRLSNLNKADLVWHVHWAISTVAVFAVMVIIYFLTLVIDITIPVRVGVILFFQAVQIGIVGYLGLTRSRVFLLSSNTDDFQLPEGRTEYAEATADFTTLKAFLLAEKSYLDPDLTASDLADGIGWAPDRLSRALRLGGATNFYDFVNQARVEAVKALALDPDNKRTNMLFLAYDAGFGSKSAFYEAFRAVEHVPPARWRRNAAAGSAETSAL